MSTATATVPSKAKPSDVTTFFSDGSRKMTGAELIQLKKEDPDGYEQIAEGIGNGTLTY
jgi:hypothetical protein